MGKGQGKVKHMGKGKAKGKVRSNDATHKGRGRAISAFQPLDTVERQAGPTIYHMNEIAHTKRAPESRF